MATNTKYRFAFDMGTNSLGWCVYRLDDDIRIVEIIRMGARIFSDGRKPKNYTSLAAGRRAARQARRRRDRVLKRRQRFMQALIEYDLMPAEESARKALEREDPYALRARGLHEPLSRHELGRALYHLARKRGFRSSRKDAVAPSVSADDKETGERQKEPGKVHGAIERLHAQIEQAGCETVGEYFCKRKQAGESVRARLGADGRYVLYLQRAMLEQEFRLLWDRQRAHHPNLLSDEVRDRLLDIMLFQRRLLPVMPGHCRFEEAEFRAPRCSPLQQRCRILQELNNLRVKEGGVADRPLTRAERDRMLALLERSKDLVKFKQLAREAGIPTATFNLESEKRKGLKGDSTSAKFSDPSAFGTTWHALDTDTREALALLVSRAEQTEELVAALLALPGNVEPARKLLWPTPRSEGQLKHEKPLLAALAQIPQGLSEAQAGAIARIVLPDEYGHLSRKALERIVPQLEAEVITYDKAVARTYGSHPQRGTGEFMPRLPYYGEVLRGHTSPFTRSDDAKANPEERRFGKIPNPTVHIGLNQLRQLVNALIKRYGHPHQIIIELAREFGASGERRREIEKQQAANQKANEELNERLRSLDPPQRETRENRLRLRLWDELGSECALDKLCIYTGQPISCAMLFSSEVEIDHILPFSESLHDGTGNKVLCLRRANRDKRNQAPHDAFGSSPHEYDWQAINDRVERLFAQSKNPALRRKAELFQPNALSNFLGDRDFLDRHLNDTAYLSRVAQEYLRSVCPVVWPSSGKLTGLVRARWGLNSLLSDDHRKNREDHRHHALDAAVIGACDRGVIQRIATAAKQAESRQEDRALSTLAQPWPGFREEIEACLKKVVVSHKPDHGKQGALHNDSNYGRRGDPDGRGALLVGRRVPLATLTTPAKLEGIADQNLRARIANIIESATTAKEINAALAAFSERTGIRRVLKEERLSVIPIHDRRGDAYRYVKGDGNYCYDIFSGDSGRWEADLVSLYHANRDPSFDDRQERARNGKPLVMRIRKGDVLALEMDDTVKLFRAVSFSNNGVALAGLMEANTDARDRNKSDPFNYIRKSAEPLRKARARLVGVNILGYVNDRGFRE